MVDKKLKGIEIVFGVISLIIISLAVINAYYISTVFYEMPIEQSYLYDTIFINVLFTIVMVYLGLIIIYKKQEYLRAFILIRLYIPLILCLYGIGYLIGLNLDASYTYHFLVPVWVYALLNILFMGMNIIIFGKIYYLKKYKTITNIYTIIITVIYLLLFLTIITDSAVPLGLLDWE